MSVKANIKYEEILGQYSPLARDGGGGAVSAGEERESDGESKREEIRSESGEWERCPRAERGLYSCTGRQHQPTSPIRRGGTTNIIQSTALTFPTGNH